MKEEKPPTQHMEPFELKDFKHAVSWGFSIRIG